VTTGTASTSSFMITFTKARQLPRNILETPLYFSVSSARSQEKRKNGMFVIYRKLKWHLICGRSGTDSKALYIYTYISVSAFLALVAENREFKKKRGLCDSAIVFGRTLRPKSWITLRPAVVTLFCCLTFTYLCHFMQSSCRHFVLH